MKKSLLFMAFLFILGGLCVNAADVVDAIDNPTKSESYGDKTFVGASETEYLFAQASPQSGFFQIRQSKSSYITNKTTFGKISSISFSLTQGSVKVYGGNTAYTSYTTSPAGVEIETVSSTGNNVVNFADEYDYFYIVPANTTIVKIADVKFTWSIADGPSEPVAYEPNFADVELFEGETFQIDLGSKHPTDIIFVSGDESVATVSDEGVITAVGIGETSISVDWDADENFNASSESATFKVNVVEKPLMFAWTITGIETSSSISEKVNSALLTEGANGTWTVVSTTNCFSSTEAGVHLGSGKSTFAGTITLSGSDIPANAIITKIAMSAKGAKDGSSTWSVSVNGDTADKTLSYSTTNFENKEVSVNLVGNEIVLTCVEATANKAIYINGITVYYNVSDIEFPSFGEAEHSFTTESSEIRIADADHAFDIFYLHTPAPAQDNVEAYAEGDADNFENKAEFDDANGEHVIPVSESGTLSYYAVHTATGTQGATETVKVTKTATTAIDAIGADAAEGEAEYFDIRGVKVNIDNAAPGLYIRRQGTTATKVIVK